MRDIFCVILVCFIACPALAQVNPKDSFATKSLFDTVHTGKTTIVKQITVDTIAHVPAASKKDSLAFKKKLHDPDKATIRSAIIPGWGQIYNHEYWKVPIVWAAIGVPIGIYVYNNTWYKRCRDAYNIVINGLTEDYNQINPALIYQGQPIDASSLQNYRNEFRQDRDYALLAVLFAWALNVVDATVFGNLKEFDVSDDLSMRVQPVMDQSLKTAGMGFVFNFK